MKLEVATDLPVGQTVTVKVTPQTAKKFTLALRRPYWAGNGFRVKVNGKAMEEVAPADSYVEIADLENGRHGGVDAAQDAAQGAAARQSESLRADVGAARAGGRPGSGCQRKGGAPGADAPVLVAPTSRWRTG